MDGKKIYQNTALLLKELKINTIDYLNQLSTDDRRRFIESWFHLVNHNGDREIHEWMVAINEVIYRFPELRQEFLAEYIPSEIASLRFDPVEASNYYHENGEPILPDSVVVMVNQVKDIGVELLKAYPNNFASNTNLNSRHEQP